MTIEVPASVCSITATEAARRIRAGDLTAEALADACLARTAERDPLVRAWAYLDPPAVLKAARVLDSALDTAGPLGPLHGVPVGVKDVILTRDMPTGYNTTLPRHMAPREDAACVAVLRAAGALIFGKTDTVEFATLARPAMTCNPHDLSRTPGASSSGSGAAVADFHVPLALGTQTGGSLIRPASFCGIFGFKPSWGLVSTEGMKLFCPSLDTIGWYGRSAQDLGLLLDVFDRRADQASCGQSLRLAVCHPPMWDQAGVHTRAALDQAAEAFRGAGASITQLELPAAFAGLHAAHRLIMFAEGGTSFLSEYVQHGDALHPSLRRLVQDLPTLDRAALRAAYDLAAECRRMFDELAAPYGAVLTPSTPGEAPPSVQGTGDYIFNALWTLLHVPCLNLPGYTTLDGLPVGVTLTGPRFSDRRVLGAALMLPAGAVER
jgi:Asp-tRNA(Asn)/Glu-tRNA(Gln) amidotransferase A subunit family amidase